jgi:hypothetical protein
MQHDDIGTDFLPFLPEVPEGGMIYYLETLARLRGRNHSNTFFCTFNGGEKTVPSFFNDMNQEIAMRLLSMQSWDVFMVGYWFIKLFPPPYVIFFAPWPMFGLHAEPAAPSKSLAIVSYKTVERGPRGRGRKFLFGLPESFVTGDSLNPSGYEYLSARVSAWAQMWHTDYTDWPYTMGLMHRYVNGSKRSPLIPTNYWPQDKMLVKQNLVKHRHIARSSRTLFSP